MNKIRNLLDKIPTGVLTGLTLALILWLTLAPDPTGKLDLPLFPGADKVVHAIMFGFLTFIVLVETMRKLKWHAVPMAGISVIVFACALTGIGIEYLQRLMDLGRSFEVLDMLSDAAGAYFIAGLWAFVQDQFALK